MAGINPPGLDGLQEMPSPPARKSPRDSNIDVDCKPYFQYHNRIASFLDWKLDWELNEDKPSPEKLARAGFFSYTKETYQDDSAVCPECLLVVYDWKPDDDPLRLHLKRAPRCDFARRQADLVKMNDAEDTAKSTQEAAASEQKNASNALRLKRPYRKRAAAGMSKDNDVATAAPDQDDGDKPRKRRAARPRKQPSPT